MLKEKTLKALIILASYFSVLYPLWVRGKSLTWVLDESLISNLFPMFGLAAFTLLWLHIVGAGLEGWLKKYVDFEKFVKSTSLLILVLMILHPLLLFISFGFDRNLIYVVYGATYVTLAIIGWVLLLVYDIGRGFKKFDFVVRHWNKILLVSTIGFIFIFFHSLGIGSDLQQGFLRYLWIFYGVTAIASTVYVYGIKRFLDKDTPIKYGL